MNIYEFINSKDIREHCEKIGHKFNSIECAYLIYQSQNHTLPEKHLAWQDLIETMPDTVIEERFNCPHYDSLHDFLRQYMALEDRLLAEFFREGKEYVYQFDALYDSDYNSQYYGYETGECIYQSFSNGLADEKENIAKFWDDLLDFSVVKKKICTTHFEKPYEIRIRFNKSGVPLEIVNGNNIISEEESYLAISFEGFWIDVPTPFQKGDIVFTNHQKSSVAPDPFVLTYLCTDKETERDKKTCKRLSEKGDSSDMFAYGYRLIESDGEVYHECDHDYLSLEYFYGDLSGGRRVLKTIQAYYKNKIDIANCMTAYHYILTDEHLKEQKKRNAYLLEFLGFYEKDTEEI